MQFREDNPLTMKGVALGRRLYYDPILSPGNSLSCGSCHKQEYAFALPGTTVLPHINLGWNTVFLWGGAAGVVTGDMEEVCRFEVEEFFGTDLLKLQTHSFYPDLFWEAFGVETISSREVAYALAQFMRTQVSGAARYDYLLGHYPERPFPTEAELRGVELFFSERGDCFHCHGSAFFTDNQFHNIGLDSVFTGSDLGLYLTTGNVADKGKFKTPTLRNIALRDRFMHDGRFHSLEEVLHHYNKEVKPSATLDPIMTKAGKEYGLRLSAQDIADLVAFLHTLTDTAFLQAPHLSEPFR